MASDEDTPPTLIDPTKGPTTQPYVAFLTISGLFTLFAAACITLRFFQRRKIRQFWWDDWAILGSGVFSLATIITTIIGAVWAEKLSLEVLAERQNKMWFAMNIIYAFCVTLSKASVVLFYTRIFSVHLGYLRALQAVGFAVAANGVVMLVGFSFIDLSAGSQILMIPLKTIDGKAFMVATCVMNLVLDVVILVIPQFSVWKLKLSQKRRIALSLVFLLGGIVCIASIVRLVFFTRIRKYLDPTFDFALPWIFTCIEMNLTIICACLPVAYGLFSGQRTKANPGYTPPSYPQTSSKLYTSFGSRSFDKPKHGNYHVKVQSENSGGSDVSEDMLPLGPIRVDRVYQVSHGTNRERDVPDV